MPETGPDLTVARQAVEDLMDDECVINRDVEGTGDDVLQPDGTLAPPDPDVVEVYSGVCKLSPWSDIQAMEVAESDDVASVYNLSIPLSAPEVRKGDVMTMTSSRRDPLMVGKALTVHRVVYSTFAVSRKLTVRLQE